MNRRKSLIADHHNIATVRWFDLEYGPLLIALGFKRSTAQLILNKAGSETTRWERK